MRRLVSLAVFKASTMVCLLNLHAMSVPPAGCVSSDCNWTQGTFFLEYVSGFFWLNNGIFTALSITSRLAAGRPWLSVLAHQWAQAAALLVAGASAAPATAETNFKGRTINVIAGGSPGGGVDVFLIAGQNTAPGAGQRIARHL